MRKKNLGFGAKCVDGRSKGLRQENLWVWIKCAFEINKEINGNEEEKSWV